MINMTYFSPKRIKKGSIQIVRLYQTYAFNMFHYYEMFHFKHLHYKMFHIRVLRYKKFHNATFSSNIKITNTTKCFTFT